VADGELAAAEVCFSLSPAVSAPWELPVSAGDLTYPDL